MDQQQIGAFIAELRKELNLSQAELGDRIGVSNKTISRWENGNYMPDISVMQLLCKEFDININELLAGKRLSDNSFRDQADENIIISLSRQKLIGKQKRLADFLEGSGTGFLVGALISPDGIRKTIIIIIAVIMILIGWYCRRAIYRDIKIK